MSSDPSTRPQDESSAAIAPTLPTLVSTIANLERKVQDVLAADEIKAKDEAEIELRHRIDDLRTKHAMAYAILVINDCLEGPLAPFHKLRQTLNYTRWEVPERDSEGRFIGKKGMGRAHLEVTPSANGLWLLLWQGTKKADSAHFYQAPFPAVSEQVEMQIARQVVGALGLWILDKYRGEFGPQEVKP
jgi:hypothetical protein